MQNNKKRNIYLVLSPTIEQSGKEKITKLAREREAK